MNVEIYQLPTLPTSLQTSSPTNGGPLTPNGLFLQGMTNNVGLAFSVGDTTPQFTINIEQDDRIGDTK
jgi:hypothetical protein